MIFIIWAAVLLNLSEMSFAVEKNNELSHLLKIAYENNPSLLELKFEIEAEKELKTADASFSDPIFGLSTLNRNVETKYVTVSQKIEFPTKYYSRYKARDYSARGKMNAYEEKKYSLRQKVITLYYSLFTVQKKIELTRANIEAVKEFA